MQFLIISPTGTRTYLTDANTGNRITYDGYATATSFTNLELGGLHLAAGAHKLVVKVVGKNPSSTDYYDSAHNLHDNGYAGAIDLFLAVPINNITTTSFTTARNNDGIAPETGTADIGPSTSRSFISETALRTLPGYNTTTNTYTPAGSPTFAMPASYTGNDNIISLGQTIPLNKPASTNNIEILATATCGTISKNPNIAFTINYSDPTNPNQPRYAAAQTPTTPDWTAATSTFDPTSNRTNSAKPGAYNTITLAGTMPYRMLPTGRDTTHPVTLYRITLPNPYAGSQYPITSITLPNIGTDLTRACTKAMHILAITTS